MCSSFTACWTVSETSAIGFFEQFVFFSVLEEQPSRHIRAAAWAQIRTKSILDNGNPLTNEKKMFQKT